MTLYQTRVGWVGEGEVVSKGESLLRRQLEVGRCEGTRRRKMFSDMKQVGVSGVIYTHLRPKTDS